MKTRELFTGRYYSLPRDKLIYLATPYSTPLYPLSRRSELLNERYELTLEVCGNMLRRGFIVYSPIVHWHPVAVKYRFRKDHKFWSKIDNTMINLCSVVFVHPLSLGLSVFNSEGVIKDISFARYLSKDVVVPCPKDA